MRATSHAASSSTRRCSPRSASRSCTSMTEKRASRTSTSSPASKRAARGSPTALGAPDDLDPVAVGITDEAEPRAALAHLVRRPLGLDALLRETRKRALQVVDADRDVAVTGSEVVRPAVVVEGELELLLLAGKAEEVVRRLLLAASDDVEVAAELEAERLVERPAALRVGD